MLLRDDVNVALYAITGVDVRLTIATMFLAFHKAHRKVSAIKNTYKSKSIKYRIGGAIMKVGIACQRLFLYHNNIRHAKHILRMGNKLLSIGDGMRKNFSEKEEHFNERSNNGNGYYLGTR